MKGKSRGICLGSLCFIYIITLSVHSISILRVFRRERWVVGAFKQVIYRHMKKIGNGNQLTVSRLALVALVPRNCILAHIQHIGKIKLRHTARLTKFPQSHIFSPVKRVLTLLYQYGIINISQFGILRPYIFEDAVKSSCFCGKQCNRRKTQREDGGSKICNRQKRKEGGKNGDL